jgi:hypothetical protein
MGIVLYSFFKFDIRFTAVLFSGAQDDDPDSSRTSFDCGRYLLNNVTINSVVVSNSDLVIPSYATMEMSLANFILVSSDLVSLLLWDDFPTAISASVMLNVATLKMAFEKR